MRAGTPIVVRSEKREVVWAPGDDD